jgi:hypothetical protein
MDLGFRRALEGIFGNRRSATMPTEERWPAHKDKPLVNRSHVAAFLPKSDGMREEAWKSTQGQYHVICETKG